jgi:GAF domain-containing protein
MKFELRDLTRLQASLFILVLMTVLGVAAIVVSNDRIKMAQASFVAARSERNEFDGKLRQARSEEDEIRRKATLFNRLQERGVIGEEQRLEWVELLKDIHDQRKLIEIRYEFALQHALNSEQTGNFGLYASTMKLQARLLHEEDLTRLLDDLRQQARALIQVKRCDVSRLPRTGAESVNSALQGLLQADCLIEWITLHEIGKNQENTK